MKRLTSALRAYFWAKVERLAVVCLVFAYRKVDMAVQDNRDAGGNA